MDRARPRRWKPAPAVLASMGLHASAIPWLIADPGAWPWVAGAIGANHVVLGTFGMMPRSQALGRNHFRLPPASAARREIALTFDDGPDPAVTPRVLDLLDRHEARASFFCIGRRALEQPRLVREMVSRGHSGENHTFRHSRSFALWPLGKLWGEIDAAQNVISDITGREPRYFRAPAGLRSPLLDPVLARASLEYTSWTRRGFDTVSRNPQSVLDRLTRSLRAGDIVLLHDGAPSRRANEEAIVLNVLPGLLARMAESGLRSVSLPEAFQTSSPR
jgi:peptidoglycan/xylan/chitin deacetylase (PgdA/CDA1 family)